MTLEEGKSYKYIGSSPLYRGKIYVCSMVAPDFRGISLAYFYMDVRTNSFLANRTGEATLWKEIEQKKPRISYWK